LSSVSCVSPPADAMALGVGSDANHHHVLVRHVAGLDHVELVNRPEQVTGTRAADDEIGRSPSPHGPAQATCSPSGETANEMRGRPRTGHQTRQSRTSERTGRWQEGPGRPSTMIIACPSGRMVAAYTRWSVRAHASPLSKMPSFMCCAPLTMMSMTLPRWTRQATRSPSGLKIGVPEP
jgi:hypothetical protein